MKPELSPHIDAPTAQLTGVDRDLLHCIKVAALQYHLRTGEKVRIFSGMRTLQAQAKLKAQGKTSVLRSYHLRGQAVDVTFIDEGIANWDLDAYAHFNEFVQAEAENISATITWGGTWKSRDAVHFQIERDE